MVNVVNGLLYQIVPFLLTIIKKKNQETLASEKQYSVDISVYVHQGVTEVEQKLLSDLYTWKFIHKISIHFLLR